MSEHDDGTADAISDDRWLTTAEVATYLGVSQSWVRGKARNLQLPSYRIGGHKLIRYRKAEVDEFIRQHRADWTGKLHA